ncbi:sigma-70 domain-containing protein [Burkholderia sp. MR1-5-21]
MEQEAHPAVPAERMEIFAGKVQGITRITKQPVSIETPLGDDADATRGDTIENVALSIHFHR